MDVLLTIEWWVGELGGFVIAGALGLIFAGIFRGVKRFKGEPAPRTADLLFKPLFYILSGAVFFLICWWIWLPLPVAPTLWVRVLGLVVGASVLFGGVALIVWGRLTLGRDYFVSTGRRAHLFESHRLVTTGPYAIIRHPMYMGILWVGLGGTLLYRTWTMAFISLMFFGLMIRAKREDDALAKRFGDEWQRYRLAVPTWLPKRRFKPRSHGGKTKNHGQGEGNSSE